MTKDNKVMQQAYQHQCPGCGSTLKFDPKSGKLKCQHCDTLVDFDTSTNVVERDFSEMAQFDSWDETQVSFYRCSNCGATSVLSQTTLATNCPFCASPVVVDEKSTGLVRPDSLVAFELTNKQAGEQLANWQRKKLFAPNSFKRESKADSIKGVYFPTWTFDAQTTSTYVGRLGKNKTRTVTRDGKTYTETYVEYFDVNGTISNTFDDIMVRGNDNVGEKDFCKLQPFSQNKYVVYSDEYLAGYIADNYSVEPFDAYQIARNKMDNEIRNDIISRYFADVVDYLNVNTTIKERSFKYMMLPIYVSSIKYNNKRYTQYVSGVFYDKEKTKAKVTGKSPVSPWKVLLAVLLGVVVVVGVALLCSLGEQPM